MHRYGYEHVQVSTNTFRWLKIRREDNTDGLVVVNDQLCVRHTLDVQCIINCSSSNLYHTQFSKPRILILMAANVKI